VGAVIEEAEEGFGEEGPERQPTFGFAGGKEAELGLEY